MTASAEIWELTLPDVLAQHPGSRGAQGAPVDADTRPTGTEPGDRVLWMAQTCHRVLEGLLACGVVGATFCPVNWRQSREELAFVLEDADPVVVFWQEAEIGDTVRAAREEVAGRATWVCHDDGGYEAFLAGAEPEPDVRARGA